MQKDRDWMAGSKTGKLRGLNTKNRADLELFLNCRGLRVDFKETQGLFSKNIRADWYAAGSNGSGPLDRDRAIQIEAVRRSNLVRRFWIRWLRTIGRAGGGGVVAGDHLCGGASPECA